MARLDPVNNPDLLPAEYTNVIDVAGFLTPGQEDRIAARIASLEEATGFKLRVLAQNYPNTPGIAIKYAFCHCSPCIHRRLFTLYSVCSLVQYIHLCLCLSVPVRAWANDLIRLILIKNIVKHFVDNMS